MERGRMRHNEWFKMTGFVSAGPVLKPLSWRESNRVFLTTFTAVLAVIYIFILLVDPYGVVPFSLPFERPLTSSQRQMYPQILRSGRYDSIVVGTSTSRLLDPDALDRALGGHFASLAMPAESAWEQVRVIDYFRRTVAAPRAVLIGVDHEWCDRGSSTYPMARTAIREKEFPAWAYDDSRWNDLFYLLNIPTLEAASRAVGYLWGKVRPRLRRDGFEVFVPPESSYDVVRARDNLRPSPVQSQEAGNAAMEFPALPWLDESLASLPGATRKYLVFPPAHVSALPAPGSPGAAREAECKQKIAGIARRRGALLVDWRLASPLTSEDSNYWDKLHYRLPIAYKVIDELDHIVKEGRESPDGSYRILVR
jgi:hypothetical protein